MSTPTLNGQLIGQAERVTRALLDRLLAGAGITFTQWVTLNVTATADPDDLETQVAGGLRVAPAEARAAIATLVERGLLRPEGGLTTAGRSRYEEIAAGIAEISRRLYADLPADDLAAAARMLAAVIGRAQSELAAG
jgi:DNA-binding MarR family transcriptional regulator